MKIATGIIIIATALIITINLITGYQSAFEADQACHAIIAIANQDSNKSNVGCDHDLETRQWIFYEKNSEIEAARVIKRFKY